MGRAYRTALLRPSGGLARQAAYRHIEKMLSANVHDSVPALELLHGKEKEVYADSAYLGIDKKTDAPKKVKFKIVKRLSTINKIVDEKKCVKAKAAETAKCSVRAKVEHAFHIVKNIFGFKRIRYKGKDKNDGLFHMLFASANLYKLAQQGKRLSYIKTGG